MRLCILVGVTSSSAIEVEAMSSELWGLNNERLQIQVYRVIERFAGSDYPIEHEIQNSLKNPGLRSLFVVGTSYRSGNRASSGSGARLPSQVIC